MQHDPHRPAGGPPLPTDAEIRAMIAEAIDCLSPELAAEWESWKPRVDFEVRLHPRGSRECYGCDFDVWQVRTNPRDDSAPPTARPIAQARSLSEALEVAFAAVRRFWYR